MWLRPKSEVERGLYKGVSTKECGSLSGRSFNGLLEVVHKLQLALHLDCSV